MKPPKKLEPLTGSDLRQAVLDLLSRRDYSRHELFTKLAIKAADHDELDILLDDMTERGWQCDLRFARQFIVSRSYRGQGPLRIRQELRQRGVATMNIENAFDDSDIDWQQLARETATKKYSSEKENQDKLKHKAQVFRFLMYRGFSSDQTENVLMELFS